jgi:peptide/nickel transport system substrate-binding protein
MLPHKSTLGLCLVLCLTGCQTDRPSEPATTTPSVPTGVPTPDPERIVWALGSAPGTLDVARVAVDPAAMQVMAQVYDRLVTYRPGTVELAPGIAANWEADADGKTFTFTVREGLTFHDGQPLDARAVVWNFQRWMDPEHPFHNGEFPPFAMLLGLAESGGEAQPSSLVERVEAIDALTVRINLNAPFAPFLHVIATVPFGIASPGAVQSQGEAYGADPDHLPVGSGPFQVIHRGPEGSVTVARFAGYRAGPAAAPAIQFLPIPDATARAAAVRAGEAHGAELPATHPLEDARGTGVRLAARPARANAWLVLNLTRSPLQDERVRRAVSLSIDRASLTKDRFGAFGMPSGQMMPPGFAGYVEDITPDPHDLEAAKALLAEADAGGLSLIIWVANQPRPHLPDPVGTADSLAAMLREAGIDASVRSESLRQFLQDRDRGRFTAWITGWEAQTADPDNFWFWHFGAGRNAAEGQYVNVELARDLVRAQRELGAAERQAIYESAARTVEADTARVFLSYTRPIVAVATALLDYEPGPMGFDDFSGVRLRAGSAPARAIPLPSPSGAVEPTGEVTAESPEPSSTPTAGPTQAP